MNIFKKIIYCTLTTVAMSIPACAFIGFWLLLHPITFWQKLLLFALGLILVGPVQFWLFIVWIALLIGCCTSDKKSHTQYHFKNRIEKY